MQPRPHDPDRCRPISHTYTPHNTNKAHYSLQEHCRSVGQLRVHGCYRRQRVSSTSATAPVWAGGQRHARTHVHQHVARRRAQLQCAWPLCKQCTPRPARGHAVLEAGSACFTRGRMCTFARCPCVPITSLRPPPAVVSGRARPTPSGTELHRRCGNPGECDEDSRGNARHAACHKRSACT